MKGKELRIRLVNTLVKHGIVDEKDAEKAFEEAMDKDIIEPIPPRHLKQRVKVLRCPMDALVTE